MVQIKLSDLTGLMDKRIYFKDRSDFNVRWVASSEYIGDGVIGLGFSQKLIPYLLQLKNKFIRYQLENVLNLKSKYSIRLYGIMKQYKRIDKRGFELEGLKRILYSDGMYVYFRNFNRIALDNDKNEINQVFQLTL